MNTNNIKTYKIFSKEIVDFDDTHTPYNFFVFYGYPQEYDTKELVYYTPSNTPSIKVVFTKKAMERASQLEFPCVMVLTDRDYIIKQDCDKEGKPRLDSKGNTHDVLIIAHWSKLIK